MDVRHAMRAYPTLLRVGVAEVVAYRAEFLVWILTTNMPLVMLGLWSAVAAEGPVGRFGPEQFTAYYLAVLVVRLITSSWVVWQLTMEIRQGSLSARLLRPLHPLLAYSAEHLAAVPLRVVVVSPLILILFTVAGEAVAPMGPARVAMLILSLVGAWLLLFCTMIIIGTLAVYMESAVALFELWLAVHAILSGYMVPLEHLPAWVSRVAHVLPFWYSLGFPVELLVGLTGEAAALRQLGYQWAYVAVLMVVMMRVWRAAMRRLVAFGG